MLIGIDNISPGVSTYKNPLGGMRHFLQNLVTYLPAQGQSHQFKLFTPGWSDLLDFPPPNNLQIVQCAYVPTLRAGRALYEQLVLPQLIRAQGITVWLGTCNVLPQWLPCRAVVVVQSLQYFTYPEFYRLWRRLYLQALISLSVRRADAVIALSEASKTEIVRRFHVPAEKVKVVYHGLSLALERRQAHDEFDDIDGVVQFTRGQPFILCVSALYGYKNLFRLVEAFAHLKPTFSQHRLIIVGGDTPDLRKQDLLVWVDQLGVGRDVVCTGHIPNRQVAAFYRHADLMAMPSLDETFGLPVLEAMALGCPVVTSNVSSMPEIAGDAAVLVDPYRVDSIANGMVQVLTNPARRQELVEAGLRRSAEFTWERTSQQILRILEEVCIR